MQHAIDLNGRDRRALKGRQQNTAQRIAEGQTESTFQRLLPVLLNHGSDLIANETRRPLTYAFGPETVRFGGHGLYRPDGQGPS